MSAIFEKTIKTEARELIILCSEVHQFLETNLMPDEVLYKLDLSVEEMVTNVVKYGYNPPSAENEVRIKVEILPKQSVTLTIEDSGHEFDPVAFDEPDTSGTIAEREVGGMGIHLTRNMCDNMHYKREENKNILTVIVNL